MYDLTKINGDKILAVCDISVYFLEQILYELPNVCPLLRDDEVLSECYCTAINRVNELYKKPFSKDSTEDITEQLVIYLKD